MGGVIGAPADGSPIPSIDQVKHQRAVDPDRRMQRRGGLPDPVAHAGNELARGARRVQRDQDSVAGDLVPSGGDAGELNLETFDR